MLVTGRQAAHGSPSSRRAWIEIADAEALSVESLVALLAEGVDRNNEYNIFEKAFICRPPRGGRG